MVIDALYRQYDGVRFFLSTYPSQGFLHYSICFHPDGILGDWKGGQELQPSPSEAYLVDRA